MENSRQLQIGVMGSAADLGYEEAIQNIAEELGAEIASRGATLIFGAEKDSDSLSTAACRGAKSRGGRTIGVTYGKGLNDTWETENVDNVIACAGERGGMRETVLVTSCDGIITVGGGSGTLTEVAVAYQANRPIVAMAQTGGWSDKLAGQYLDGRERLKIESAATPKEAVDLIFQLIQERLNNS